WAPRRYAQPYGAPPDRGAASHRPARRGALHGAGAVAARFPVPGAGREAAGAAHGRSRLHGRRAPSRLSHVPRRGDSSHGRGAVPASAEELVNRRVLVVDDEKGIREALQQVLEYEEIEVQACASGSEALVRYAEFRPHLVFLDVKMQGMDGLETLRKLRELDARAQVVMISGHGTIQTAVEATQLGAYDFLEKPLARAIHPLWTRTRGPFVEVNCAAIPTELIESELFGHMKGSFTGAFADRAGKFELADGGTLFLDEIGDMSLSAQAKVLRAME